MIQMIKGLLQVITGSADRFFKALGRIDETIAGKIYQHYGFRSSPPEGTELMTVTYGNNCASVAENDGSMLGIDMAEGDSVFYSIHGTKKNIIYGHDDQLNVQSDGIITIRVTNPLKTIALGYQPVPAVPGIPAPTNLVTINFINLGYNLHTHSLITSPTTLTGPPITPPEIPLTPYTTTYTGAN